MVYQFIFVYAIDPAHENLNHNQETKEQFRTILTRYYRTHKTKLSAVFIFWLRFQKKSKIWKSKKEHKLLYSSIGQFKLLMSRYENV